jgi:hypothetical protein
MGTQKIFYKRNLPHFQPEGYSYFITIRLAGTIPKEVIEELKGVIEKRTEQDFLF